MTDISDVANIKKPIKKMDAISEEEIGAVQRITYADVTKGKEKFREYQKRGDIKHSNRTIYIVLPARQIKCWTCEKEGHVSRQCRINNGIVCYGCQQTGHTRRFCPNIICRKCNGRGHREQQCLIQMNRNQYQRNYV